MSDASTSLVVGLLLSASYILPPSFNPAASFVLVFLLIFSIKIFLPLPFLIVIVPFYAGDWVGVEPDIRLAKALHCRMLSDEVFRFHIFVFSVGLLSS